MPSSTPAGTRTVTFLVALTRPSPAHSEQGVTMTVPCPRQAGHTVWVTIWPRIEFATRWTDPVPPHSRHATGSVPGAAQEPWHVGHSTGRVWEISFSAPKTTSSSSRERETRASWPRRPRGAGPVRTPPKKDSKISENAPNPLGIPDPCRASSPPRSYILRDSSSDRTA